MLPVIKGKDLVIFLETLGFIAIRRKGSHIRMKSMTAGILRCRFTAAKISLRGSSGRLSVKIWN
jgi:hypothetical protein